MAKKSKKPPQADTKPTIETILVCLVAIVILFSISALTDKEVPLIVYAIIAGVLFGIGNVKNIIGGGK